MPDSRFFLDSNICIYLLGGAADAVRARVEMCEEGELAASTIAVAEVMLGARRLGAVAETEAFFSKLRIYPFEKRAAMAYSGLPFRRASFDRLIAAHAIALGLTLVTNNVRDYSDISGLKIENWAEP